jgi:hypothetical protein
VLRGKIFHIETREVIFTGPWNRKAGVKIVTEKTHRREFV